MFATKSERALDRGLLQRLADARTQTDDLFAIVRPEGLYDRPIAERHRIIFYVGHLEAFDWNLLKDALGLKLFNPDYDKLFAFGIDPIGDGLPTDQPRDWPLLEQVHQYRDEIRRRIDSGLEDVNDDSEDSDYPLSVLLNVAIEHRLMHAETLAYMFHRLPLDRKIAPPPNKSIHSAPLKHQMIVVPAGPATLGISSSDPHKFGWDNEYEEHAVYVPGFAIDKYKVTNGDYLQFVESGGYKNHELWQDADWKWVTSQSISHPAFWELKDDGWFFRTMFDEVPLPLDWPVYVSHAEASAYALWAGKKLPREEQWQKAAMDRGNSIDGNFDCRSWDPEPVNDHYRNGNEFGVEGMFGNGWEWTSTVFEPFEGFRAFRFYPGYSANFFDGQHYVMKGGSARTARCMIRPSFRNWFQSHYPYVYAGFRCVDSNEAAQ